MSDWFDGAGAGSLVDVAALLDSHGMELVNAAIAAGALVSLGLTSDGGALGLTVTVDGRWRREYFRDPEQLDLWMQEGLPSIIDACARRPASSEQRSRPRRSRGL